MRRLTIAFTLALLTCWMAQPAAAGNRNCNSTLFSQGVCRDTGNYLLFYDAPTAALIDLRDAIVAEYNYQSSIVCASSRQFEPLLNGQASKILNAAGAATDSCSVGTVVANPQGVTDFADAVIDYELRNRVIQWKLNEATATAGDPTSIPTPDVGQ